MKEKIDISYCIEVKKYFYEKNFIETEEKSDWEKIFINFHFVIIH